MHLLLKHEEVHHLVEHGHRIFAGSTSLISKLICSLASVHFEGLHSISKVTNFIVDAIKVGMETLLKDCKCIFLR